MAPWLETAGVFAIAFSGILLGRVFSRMRWHFWLTGYFFCLALIAILVAGRFVQWFVFTMPFSWILAGEVRFVVLAFAVTMGLTIPLSRLPHKFEKVLVSVLIAVVVSWFSFLPFLFPAFIKTGLLSGRTIISSDGICFQTRDYTCGPAAAVTALTKLGFEANEGRIAVASRTNPVTGTLPSSLARSLEDLYGMDGLRCEYRRFESVEQLKDAGLTLVVVKNTLFSDHCVAVLEVTDSVVTLADPVEGTRKLSHTQFEEIWRFSGIVLKKSTPIVL